MAHPRRTASLRGRTDLHAPGAAVRAAAAAMAALLAGQAASLAAAPAPARAPGPVATARLGPDRLELRPRPGGRRALYRLAPGRAPEEIHCGALPGAWGLWATDVNGDRRPDLVIALRKPARFDPVVANRLHVYTLVGRRCVPLWRGTRLAGRFTRVRPAGGQLHVLEGIGGGRQRLARYRWTGFGYAVDRVLWQGRGPLPRALHRKYLNHR